MRTGESGGLSRLRNAVASRLRTREPAAPEAVAAASAERAAGNAPLPPDPLVSVVVPMYQVEAYLEDCLTSVQAQDYENLEVILVDDGSTDGTAEIARGFAERDPRFRVVRKDNGGLGAARNTGLDECTGDLVAFLDSDDFLPAGAYRKMVRALTESGSDFVVGAHYREEAGGRQVQRSWVKQLHSTRRLGVRLDDVPDVLANVFAWTKMFRRDFVERIGLRFPEGVRYEDQVPITRAYLEARSFDIIPATVYHWRRREDFSSITQQKGQTADLHDRFAAKEQIAELLGRTASPEVRRSWYAKVFTHDLTPYLRAAMDADADFWTVLRGHAVRLYDAAPAGVWDEVELRQRVAAFLAAHGERAELAELFDYPGLPASNFPVERVGDALYARLPLRATTAVPEDLLRLRPADLRAGTLLRSLDWSVPGTLSVRGLAFLRHVEPGRVDVATSLTLARPRGGAPVTARLRAVEDPEGNVDAARVHEDHTSSGFEATVDLHELVRASDGQPKSTWNATVTLEALGVSASTRFLEAAQFGSALAVRPQLVDDALVSGGWDEITGLSLTVRRRYAAVRSARWAGDAFELDVALSEGPPVTGLAGGDVDVPVEVTGVDARGARLRVRPQDLAGLGTGAVLDVVRADESRLPLFVPGEELDWLPGGSGEVAMALTTSPRGQLRAMRDAPAVVVDSVGLDGDVVRLAGRVHGLEGFSACLSGPRATSHVGAAEVTGDRFVVTVPARRTFWGGVETVLPRNAYTLEVDAGGVDVRVRAALALQSLASEPPVRGWRLEVGERRGLVVRRAREVAPDLMSAFGQHRLQSTVYADARAGDRTDAVLFECFGGASTGDSPAALCDLLLARGTDLDLVWSVNDESVPVPDGTRSVTRLSPEWYAALGSVRYLVSNSNFPPSFEKAPGQVHVQTWHGTPLKRIGHDIEDTRFFNRRYLDLMDREAALWDYLVSPSPFCTEVLPRALATRAQVLEIGYPRNDLLLVPDAAGVRRAVRAELGIPEDQKVVLYAPTWRENARAVGGYQKVLHLDVDEVVAAREDVTVLVRGHSNVAGRASVGDGARVLDVTGYPDPAPLYLAADVLVTDYSSVFFDFALTDKPILFLVPDLEEYRDELRGFYLDLEEVAPGPLLRSTAEVLDHLDDAPAERADARARLRQRFAPHDDGHAAERLLQALLGHD